MMVCFWVTWWKSDSSTSRFICEICCIHYIYVV